MVEFANISIWLQITINLIVKSDFLCDQQIATFHLKGYPGVSSIHGLTHCDTELDPPRDQVCRPLVYVVVATSEITAQ